MGSIIRFGKRSNKPRDRRGNVIVECAIAMPLVFLCVFATVEICNAIFLKQSLSVAAYEGARVAIVPGADEENVLAQVQEVFDSTGVQGGIATVEPSNFQNSPIGTYITVTTEAPPENSSGIHQLFYGSGNITVSVKMLKEY